MDTVFSAAEQYHGSTHLESDVEPVVFPDTSFE